MTTREFEHPENQPDNFWGCCPICGESDGCVNIGRIHWFYCDAHHVKWSPGDNLFSSWQYETPDVWHANQAMLADYTWLSYNAATDGVDWDEIDATAGRLLLEVTP